MAAETNKPRDEKNNDFGLPRAEFKPIETTGNNSRWLRATLIIASILLVIGVGIVFWLFQRPSTGAKKDFLANTLEGHQAEDEQEQDDELEDQSMASDVAKSTTDLSKTKTIDIKENKDIKEAKVMKPAKKPQGIASSSTGEGSTDSDEGALEELDKLSDSFIAKPEHKPSSFIEQLRAGEFDHTRAGNEEEPPIMTITAPKGLYYVIVASYIDMDLAMDYAQKIAQKGPHIKLIMPGKDKYFVRVAIVHEKTFEEANQKAQELKGEYGKDIWVMKY